MRQRYTSPLHHWEQTHRWRSSQTKSLSWKWAETGQRQQDAELEALEPGAAVRAGIHGVAERPKLTLGERKWKVVPETSSPKLG